MKLSLALLIVTGVAFGQSGTASLGGEILDPSGAVVSGAALSLKDEARASELLATSNGAGAFVFPQVIPGTYKLTISKDGFASAEYPRLVLNVSDASRLTVRLTLGQKNDSVTVISEAPLASESPAVVTAVNRQFMENQPLNGRSFQSLIELAPGVTPSTANLPNPGQFSVNGQRTGSNYFTVDGVSANFGSTASVNLYETAGGGVPSYSALGTTASLASVDAVQEFAIQTSTYAPEYGRQPGAQVAIVTRSGTNQFHGSLFEYFRNSVLDANDFFANRAGLAKPPVRQNDFGGTAGAPVLLPGYSGKDRTFFFFSYEGVRLRQPFVTEPLLVPSLSARQNASGAVKDVLNAFPLPTGPTLAALSNEAPYQASFSRPVSLDATSLRVDHRFSANNSIFGRYDHAPSEDKERARFCAASCVADLRYWTDTGTVGWTSILKPAVTNDVRFNFSRSRVNQTYFIDTFGGAIVPPASSLYPSFTTRDRGYIYIEVNGSGSNTISDGLFSDNRQRQINAVDTVAVTAGAHSLKFGADYRRLFPVNNAGLYKRQYLPDSITDLATNVPTAAAIIAPQEVLYPVYNNYSFYAQDGWRVSPKLTLTLGVRWDINPAPYEKNGNNPLTVTNLNNLAALALAPRSQRLYDTGYGNFAPRVGAAWQATPKTVVRGGFGVFYDLGYAFSGNSLNAGIFPFAATQNLTASYTSATFAGMPPPVSLNPPYSRVYAYAPGFQIPYSLEYNATVEQTLDSNDIFSVAYVGAAGRRLGRVESLRNPNPSFARIDLVRDAASSNYNSLQAQFRRRMSAGLQTIVSYTFSKSLDTVSEESQNNFQAPAASFNANADRGPSNFDTRHNFSASLSYEIPHPKGDVARRLFGGFALDSLVRSRSALPVNLITNKDPFGISVKTVSRPDVVPGAALYLDDPNAPGGRRFNPAAFDSATPVKQLRQGSLGRNALRGFSAAEIDLSVRRDFPIREGIRLQMRADAYNIFNHPNFDQPIGTLTDGNFGRSVQMLANGLGGLSSLYQLGGPRSMQITAKLLF